MKRTLFVFTHLHSGWERLADVLESDPRVNCFSTGLNYDHPDDIIQLGKYPHRMDNRAAIWVEFLFYNHNFTMKRLSHHFKFVFWSGDWDAAREGLIKDGYTPEGADGYYQFRLEGMRQYHARVPWAAWNPELKTNLILGSIFG